MMGGRCKGIPLKPCCEEMESVLMFNDLRDSILYDEESPEGERFWLWWRDCDCSPLRFCPFCGKKVEEIRLGDGRDGKSE